VRTGLRVDREKQHVSCPCRNVLKRVIPHRPWGVLAVANPGGCIILVVALTRPGGNAYRPKMVG